MQAAWLRLIIALYEQDANAYRAVMLLGGQVFPEHYVGILGDMNHPMQGRYDEDEEPEADDWDDDELDDDWEPDEQQNLLFETLAHTMIMGKRRGWEL